MAIKNPFSRGVPAPVAKAFRVGDGLVLQDKTLSAIPPQSPYGSGANPTATASNTAVNGSASTFMRSDGAPAIQLGSASVKGVVQVDGTTLVAASGVLTATGVGVSPTGNTLSAEILADVPTGYWKCDETSGTTLNDSSGNGFHMTTVGAPTLSFAYLTPTDNTKYMRVATTTSGASVTSALGTSPPLSGDYSVECVVMGEGISGAILSAYFSLGLNSSETEANNIQAYLYRQTNGNNKLTLFFENGAGTDTNVTEPISTYGSNKPEHLVAVKDGTAKTVTFFRNGWQLGPAVAYTNNPTGGTGSIQARIGYDGTLTTSVIVIGHVAFYNGIKLSAARVWAHAKASGLAGNG